MTDPSKTQKIDTRILRLSPTKVTKQGIADEEAKKLIADYRKALMDLVKLEKKGKIGFVRSFLLKRRLHSLAVREFNLWKSMPFAVKKHNFSDGREVVSRNNQIALELVSSRLIEQINALGRKNVVSNKFMKGIYKYKLTKLPKPKNPQRHK